MSDWVLWLAVPVALFFLAAGTGVLLKRARRRTLPPGLKLLDVRWTNDMCWHVRFDIFLTRWEAEGDGATGAWYTRQIGGRVPGTGDWRAIGTDSALDAWLDAAVVGDRQ